MRHSYLLAFFLCLGQLLHAQNDPVTDFVNAPELSQASIGLLVKNLETGAVVASHDPMVCRIPASVTKVITTATAMEILGDTFRFRTRIEMTGQIVDSVLKGNLYIRGGGDPTLESEYNPTKNTFYTSVLEKVQSLGIKRIEGHIVGDASYFQEDGAPFGWLIEDHGSHYAPTPSSLSIHDNRIKFVVTSDSNGCSLSKITPYTPLFTPRLMLSQKGKDADWRITKADFSWQPAVQGSVPMNTCQNMMTEIPEPALFAADSLRRLLIGNGIIVTESAVTTRKFDSEPNRKEILCFKSSRLKEIEQKTNYISINWYAENIFRILSKKQDSIAPCTDWRAAQVISKFWNGKSAAANKVFQVDGSGMSMKNALSPQYLVDVLSYMYKDSKNFKSFLSTLPIAGKSGTVAGFLKGTKLEGKAYVKSGSMTRVLNYAGYINVGNKWYAFCVMVSNFTDKKLLKQQITKVLTETIEEDTLIP